MNPRLYDGLNSVNFCTSEVTLFEKKEPKSASRRLNELKKRVSKNFLDELLNYRSAGRGPNKKSYRDFDRGRDQKKLVPHISNPDDVKENNKASSHRFQSLFRTMSFYKMSFTNVKMYQSITIQRTMYLRFLYSW